MSKKSKSFDRDAASRIARATSLRNDGKIPKGSFASVVDARVQREEAKSRLQGREKMAGK